MSLYNEIPLSSTHVLGTFVVLIVTRDVEDKVRGPSGGGAVHHGSTDDPVKVLLHGPRLGGGVHSSCLNRHLNG